MTSDKLVGCAAKLKRAQAHADELKRLLLAFQEANPYPAVLNFHRQTSEWVGVLTKDLPEPPSYEWGPILGDIGHNLSSALDNLVCVLAVVKDPRSDCETTMFPIYLGQYGAVGYDRQGARRVKALSTIDQDTIRSLQPYQAGDNASSHPLWLLRELNRIDKHRRVHVVAVEPQEQIGNLIGVSDAEITDVRAWNRTKAGDEIFRCSIHATGPQPKGDVEVSATVQVEFAAGSGDLDGVQLGGFVETVVAYVRNNVFPKFEGTVGKLPY